MKYQNYLNNVLKLLQDYRDSVNGVKAIYDSDKAKHDRELKDMQGKYTDCLLYTSPSPRDTR